MRKLSNFKWWFLGISSFCTIVSSTKFVSAQVIPDNTLPNNSEVKVEGNKSIIEGGTTAGGNLFHSFEKFSVPTGGEANFNSAVDIQNIITRVTGNSVSDINGLIKANGTANLFLINPSGIVFGENARLDIGGSFVGSTADAIGFGENNFFSASSPENSSSLLEVNPSALFFNQVKAASIQSKSVADSGRNLSDTDTARGLRVPDGKSLLLLGGDININGGGLYAYGGRVELGGLASMGTVGLNQDGNNHYLSFSNGIERSDVSVNNRANVAVIADDGGSIAINARNFEMSGSSLLIAGIESGLGSDDSRAGNIDLNVTNVINLDNKSQVNNLVLRGAKGQGGNININTSKLQLKDGAVVSTSTYSEGNGGNLTVDASDVQLISSSKDGQVASGFFAQSNSTGNAGDLTIKTNTLLLKDGSSVSSRTFGEGKGGNLTIDASDVQLVGRSKNGRFGSGLFSSTGRNSTGNAGDLTIKTNTLLLKDGSSVGSRTFGEGKGGNLTIKANTLLVKDGAQVSTNTFKAGNGGNLTIDAQDVQLIGESKDGIFGSGLFSSTDPNSIGDAGDLTIKANTLLVKDGARIDVSTFGQGKGGNLTVDAQNVQLIESKDGQFGSGLFASAGQNSIGDSGDLTIKTNTLLLKDGASVGSRTFGEGRGGNLMVDAQDVKLIGDRKDGQFVSSLFASAGGNSGDAGNLTIKTNTLLVKDGAVVLTDIFGEAKGGNLSINAQDMQLIGTSSDGRSGSSLSIQTRDKGDTGELKLNVDRLLVQDGAQVSVSTFGSGAASAATINASESIQVNGDGSGLFNRTGGTGDAGNFKITTRDMTIKSGAQVSVDNFTELEFEQVIIKDNFGERVILVPKINPREGSGNAGNLVGTATSIELSEQGQIVARSAEGQGGNIILNITDLLLMRRNSQISTSAGIANTGGDGGNITINNPNGFIIAASKENNDIIANAFNGKGGRVKIDATVIFGTVSRSREDLLKLLGTDDLLQINPRRLPTNDITAISQQNPNLSGFVEIITPQIDLNNGLLELPTIPVDTEVAQGCYSPGYAQSSFIVAGDGGLPPNPKDILTPNAAQIDWVSVKPSNNRSLQPVTTKPTTSAPKRIVEATGATLNAKGQIVLAANPSTVISNNISKNNSIPCQSN